VVSAPGRSLLGNSGSTAARDRVDVRTGPLVV